MAGYGSIDDAVAAALAHINRQENADRQEYIGLIYQDPETGKYRFTDPATTGQNESVGGAFKIPKGSLRALVHNHPASYFNRGRGSRENLSREDVQMAKQLGVPSYIGVDDEVLKWNGTVSGRGGHTVSVLAQIAMDLLPQRRTSNMVAKR